MNSVISAHLKVTDSRGVGHLFHFIALVVLCILLLPLHSLAQTSEDLFNGDVLHDVHLVVNPRDWAELKLDFEGNNYYAADFHLLFNGKDVYVPGVAIRSRGAGSRSPIKPSLKIEFNRFESRNTPFGLENLVLRGNTQDASMMHERVAMEFLRKMGIPAPRESHARLFVNGEYLGVYTLVEDVDQPFLQRNLGEDNGYLYSYQWIDSWILQSRGSSPDNYSPLPFKPETHEIDPNPGPLMAMVDAINQAPLAQFKSQVSQYLDLNGYLREIAAENFVAEEDGLVGNYGVNNFYLYRPLYSLQSVIIPWDKSNAFFDMDWPIDRHISAYVLSVRALALPELLAQYRAYLRQAAEVAGGPGGWLEQEITKEYNLIRQAAYDDKNKICDPGATGTLRPCSNDMFDAEAQFMLTFARQRAADVTRQLLQVGADPGANFADAMFVKRRNQ